MSRLRAGPWTVASLAVLLYAVYIGGLLLSGTDARSFVVLGRHALARSHSSAVIRIEPHRRFYTPQGYDGQYSYFIAVDPTHARYYMDWPAYRYGRILYPALARALSLGRADWVPGVLLLINLFAVGMGVWAIAATLARAGLSPWPSLLYAIYPGTVISVTRDLGDALALSLVALAVYLFHSRRRYALSGSAALFALAGLTRETTIAVAAVYSLQLLRERRFAPAAGLIVVAAVPYLAWHTFVGLWLSSFNVPAAALPTYPLWGLVSYGISAPIVTLQMISVVVPSLIASGIAIAAWRRLGPAPEILALLVNVLIGVLLLNHASFIEIQGSSRAAAGVPLFLLFCLPLVERAELRVAWLLRLAWMMWTFPTLVRSVVVSVRWVWMGTAALWLIALEVEIVRHLRRGIRSLRKSARPVVA